MSGERIYIAIPVHGRLKLAEECIATVSAGCGDGDFLDLWMDGADSRVSGRVFGSARKGGIEITDPAIGIERQRRQHFEKFDRMPKEYTHLYLTDADAPHDPNWRSELLRIQASVGGAPVCGYNTRVHADMMGNTIAEKGEVIWRRVAPGISYLLTREHVEKVVRWLKANPNVAHWSFDWQVPAILGYRFAITKTSYCDHVGVGGYHHPPGAGWEGGDRALNQTPWLVAKRTEIVAKLSTP